MKIINHKSIASFETIILFLSKIYNFFSRNEIRVLVYHHIGKKDINLFYRQLNQIKKSFNFITPKQFEDHVCNKYKLKGKNVLLTFDDGFNSNYLVAKKILDKLKIKAIFFVPSDFIKINSALKAKKFIRNNILDQRLPSDFSTLNNMSIQDLKQLIKNGHTIGGHSKTHANLGSIYDTKKLKNEIINSAGYLEKALNTKIKHFAFTYGNYTSMSFKSLKLALSQYNFIYSCLRGNNHSVLSNEIIKRDAIYLDEGSKLLSIFLSGFFDFKYFFQIISINKIIKKITK